MGNKLKVNIQKKLKEFDLDVDFELKQKYLNSAEIGRASCRKRV